MADRVVRRTRFTRKYLLTLHADEWQAVMAGELALVRESIGAAYTGVVEVACYAVQGPPPGEVSPAGFRENADGDLVPLRVEPLRAEPWTRGSSQFEWADEMEVVWSVDDLSSTSLPQERGGGDAEPTTTS